MIRTKADYATQDNTGNPKRVTIIIEDNGSGVPAEKIDIFWKKFTEQTDGWNESKEAQDLVWLSARGIIEGHGGKIWIYANHSISASIKFTMPVS